MRRQFTYRVYVTYRPDPTMAPGDLRYRTATVRASSEDRAINALFNKILRDHRSADLVRNESSAKV